MSEEGSVLIISRNANVTLRDLKFIVVLDLSKSQIESCEVYSMQACLGMKYAPIHLKFMTSCINFMHPIMNLMNKSSYIACLLSNKFMLRLIKFMYVDERKCSKQS